MTINITADTVGVLVNIVVIIAAIYLGVALLGAILKASIKWMAWKDPKRYDRFLNLQAARYGKAYIELPSKTDRDDAFGKYQQANLSEHDPDAERDFRAGWKAYEKAALR